MSPPIFTNKIGQDSTATKELGGTPFPDNSLLALSDAVGFQIRDETGEPYCDFTFSQQSTGEVIFWSLTVPRATTKFRRVDE